MLEEEGIVNLPFDPEKVLNTKLAFVFREHEIPLYRVARLREEYKRLMKGVFALGERNIYVVESPEQSDFKPEQVVFPKKATDFDIEVNVNEVMKDERARKTGAHSRAQWRSVIKRMLTDGSTPALFRFTILQAVDELNDEGYKTGLLYEKGVKPSEEFNRFLHENVSLELSGFKDRVRELHKLDDVRDQGLIVQICQLVDSSPSQPTNIFIERGTSHAGMLDLLPQHYRERVIMAFSSLDTSVTGSVAMRVVDRTLKSGKEPMDDIWRKAHRDIMRIGEPF